MRAAWKAGKCRANIRSKMGRLGRKMEKRGKKKKQVFIAKLDKQLKSELELQQPSRSAQMVNVAGIATQNRANKRLKKPN